MKALGIALVFLAATACSSYPHDIEGTTDRIARTKILRVGVMGDQLNPGDGRIWAPIVAQLAQRLGARTKIETSSAERLLVSLQDGALDVVVGEVAEETPWATDVSVIEPMTRHKHGTQIVALSLIAKNGENRWIGMLEREVRDGSPSK